MDLSDLDGANGFQINGTVADGWAGRSVSSAGDINHDGFDDVIIGSRDRAYVLYGNPNSLQNPVIAGGMAGPGRINLMNQGATPFTLYGSEDIDFSDPEISVDPADIVFAANEIDALTGELTEGVTFGVAEKKRGGFKSAYEDVNDDGYLDLVVKAQTSLKRGEDLESPFTVASVMSSGDTELFAYATTADGTELLFSATDTTSFN